MVWIWITAFQKVCRIAYHVGNADIKDGFFRLWLTESDEICINPIPRVRCKPFGKRSGLHDFVVFVVNRAVCFFFAHGLLIALKCRRTYHTAKITAAMTSTMWKSWK